MRFSSQELDLILSERLSPLIEKLNQRIQRTLRGPVTHNGLTSFAVRKYRKFRELEELAVLSWYIRKDDQDFGVLLRLDLEEKAISQFANKERLAILLSSKEEMLFYLIRTQSDNDFFGNLLPSILKIGENLKFLTLYPKRARAVQRHRGYRDHGSCRPETRWLPTSDWSLTEIQNQLELEKSFQSTLLTQIQRRGCLAVRLPELEDVR